VDVNVTLSQYLILCRDCVLFEYIQIDWILKRMFGYMGKMFII